MTGFAGIRLEHHDDGPRVTIAGRTSIWAKPTCQRAVCCVGADGLSRLSRHSRQLQLRLPKHFLTKQTENSDRMHSIGGSGFFILVFYVGYSLENTLAGQQGGNTKHIYLET